MARIIAALAGLLMVLASVACDTATVTPTLSSPPGISESAPRIGGDAPAGSGELDVNGADDDPEDSGEHYKEAEEYDIPGLAETGLTNEQFQKVDDLLYSCLASGYFTDPTEIDAPSLLDFVYQLLNSYGGLDYIDGYYQDEESFAYKIQSRAIEKLLKSAFGIEYVSSCPGDNSQRLSYADGTYVFMPSAGDPVPCPEYYNISRISDGLIRIDFDVILEGGGELCYEFQEKAQAVLQEDKDSVFGYRIVSLMEITEYPFFSDVSASSGSSMPMHSMDGDLSTAWKAEKGTGQWLKLASNTQQTITGLSFYTGDRSVGDEADFYSGDMMVVLEFSDGSMHECVIPGVYNKDEALSITFGKAIKTTYIKITIVSAEADSVCIAEVKPF